MKTQRVFNIMDGFRVQTDSFEVTVQSTSTITTDDKGELLSLINEAIENSLSGGSAIQKMIDAKHFKACQCKLSYIHLG